MEEECLLEDTDFIIQEDQRTMRQNYDQQQNMTREEYEAAFGQNHPQESILEWFDRSVEGELEKHRNNTSFGGENLLLSQGLAHHHVIEGGASGVEIMSDLTSTVDTDLSDAVLKFAKAEAIVAFEGAVRAAERAAAEAPPELAEEAAAAGARGFQAELTGVVRDKVPGDRPIEVIGYVGITKPKNPRQSKR